MNCKVCKNTLKSYWQKQFCSKSCAATYNNKKFPKKIKKVNSCKVCGNKTKNKFIFFCKACIEDNWDKSYPAKPILLRTLKEEIELNKNKGANIYNRIRGALRLRRKRLNKDIKCIKCGYKKHVEYCHIKPIHTFSLNTLIKEINSDENIATLCPNCHWEYDNNLLQL